MDAIELIDEFLAGLAPSRNALDRSEVVNLMLDVRQALVLESGSEGKSRVEPV